MKQDDLIDDLIARTNQVIEESAKFSQLSDADLNLRRSPTSWSILECLEHLNLYGDFYLPEIENRLAAAMPKNGNVEFKSGWLGNYFALSMLPGENGKLNKMKTFKKMNPIHQQLHRSVLDRFRTQQNKLNELLLKAKSVDVERVRTSISISTLIKLRLGDTLRVVVYHNQRHLAQALRNLA